LNWVNTAGERVYPEQIADWEDVFLHGPSAPISKAEREQLKEQTTTHQTA